MTAAFAAGAAGLGGLALWLGLLAVPVAAAASFVAISDVMEDRLTLIHAVTNSLALVFVVLGCAVRSNALAGAAAPPLATWALLAVLFAYSVPVVTWVIEPVKVTRTKPERRRRRTAVELEPVEVLDRAA